MKTKLVPVPLSSPLAQRKIEEILREYDPFVTATFELMGHESLYSVDAFLQHHACGGQRIQTLFDRNLFSPVIRVAKGGEVRRENVTDQLAMALMAFTAAARIDIEPSLALYEVGASSGHGSAREELSDYRRAEALDAIAWENLALRRATEIPSEVLKAAVPHNVDVAIADGEFERELTEWKRHRLALTKLAVVLRSTPGVDGMREMIRWSEEDAYFDGLVLVLATILLSPKREGRLLKGLFSSDPEKRVAGVNNAAWDLTYVSQLKKRVDAKGGLWIFCSADKGLRFLTRWAIGMEGEIEELLGRYWSKSESTLLHQEYQRSEPASRRWAGMSREESLARVEVLESMQEELLMRLRGFCP